METIIKCGSGFLHSAIIEFYMDWLEELLEEGNEQAFGIISAGFVKLFMQPKMPTVTSIKRLFPATLDNAIEILDEWPIEEYVSSVLPRLQHIAEMETMPRIFPEVIQRLRAN
jgi:hypothetical protein